MTRRHQDSKDLATDRASDFFGSVRLVEGGQVDVRRGSAQRISGEEDTAFQDQLLSLAGCDQAGQEAFKAVLLQILLGRPPILLGPDLQVEVRRAPLEWPGAAGWSTTCVDEVDKRSRTPRSTRAPIRSSGS